MTAWGKTEDNFLCYNSFVSFYFSSCFGLPSGIIWWQAEGLVGHRFSIPLAPNFILSYPQRTSVKR